MRVGGRSRAECNTMIRSATHPSAAPLATWAALLRKECLCPGGLPLSYESSALALVWSVLPPAAVFSEPQINQYLKAALAGAAACLDTDHVESRRGLVDAEWLQRDGFGSEYRALAWHQLTPEKHATAAPLRGLDMTAWVTAERAAWAANRATRRRQWRAAHGE